jgi:molybdopterin molybdotransferase
MIELERALELLLRTEPRVVEETAPLDAALGRVLARDVVSPIDSPPFDKSAMDGFAVGKGDDSVEFRILETVAAGGMPGREIRECARIMTGAMLPKGAGRVIRKEFVEEGDGIARLLHPENSDNVIVRGENLRVGDTMLRPKVITPQDIGILAASGIISVPVARTPRIGILSTGSEIKAPGETLGPGEIYNSNGPQLRAQLAAMRCASEFFGVISDEPRALRSTIARALEASDLLLVTGGVSEGDFDYVPRCLVELGAEVIFHGVAVKPGKPTLFARKGEAFVFGLPGNPVTTFVIFEVFVRPFLYKRMGIDWTPAMFRGVLGARIKRRGTERAEFLPVRVRGGAVMPVSYHGSAHLNALAEADGLILIGKGVGTVEKGAEVDVRPI